MRNESLLPLDTILVAFPNPSDSVQWARCASLWLAPGEFFRKHFTGSSRDLAFGVSTGFGFSSWHWQLPSAPVVCPPGPSSRQEQLGLGAELWDVAVLPCSRVCCRGRLSRGSASSGKRWGRESKTGSVSNQSLLMLELPNSVFTHQGLRLMVIYSHFLVNN